MNKDKIIGLIIGIPMGILSVYFLYLVMTVFGQLPYAIYLLKM